MSADWKLHEEQDGSTLALFKCVRKLKSTYLVNEKKHCWLDKERQQLWKSAMLNSFATSRSIIFLFTCGMTAFATFSFLRTCYRFLPSSCVVATLWSAVLESAARPERSFEDAQTPFWLFLLVPGPWWCFPLTVTTCKPELGLDACWNYNHMRWLCCTSWVGEV